MKQIIAQIIFGLGLLFLNNSLAQQKESAKKPNVILILADDLGYSDISSYGSEDVETPNLDLLAKKGLRFTNYHTGASICSPSRAALLTGAYPQRTGLYLGINPNREAHWFLGLNPDEITIAEQFKKQDYTTFMVGKWHLGTEEKFSCLNQGFDDYYGMPCNYDHSKKFFDGRKLIYEDTPLDKLTELYNERIKTFINEKASEPFFLFYSHNYPHTPYKVGKKFEGSSSDGVRGDVIQEFDWSVGEIMNTLKEKEILSNTIIIFTSDNGPVNNKYAEPHRGTKFVSLEGGHKVPFIVYWNEGIEKSAVVDKPIYAMDLFPTLSEIIGVKIPDDRKYDGKSLLPIFNGNIPEGESETPYYYYNCENLQAVSYKNWKLHLSRSLQQIPFWDKSKTEFIDIPKPVLFNLADDISESQDIAQNHPDIVDKLLRIAQNAREELGEYNMRGIGQRPTGTLFPDVPIISHPRDWDELPMDIKEKAIRK
ncbi:arylsulfatase [Arenibacter palladensis]|uniref:Arylsulfatase n=1 Tax=Arenibacter palladensis TaxID=237373 RepID=A0A1M5C4Z9_9FLAO|nr:sulfatase-like hydrolase/transferase [Arenibacter palladensis]SHF49781.1 arylsulfatase [Arenibacter palladensis]